MKGWFAAGRRLPAVIGLLIQVLIVIHDWRFIVDATPIWSMMVGQALLVALGAAVAAALAAFVMQGVRMRRV